MKSTIYSIYILGQSALLNWIKLFYAPFGQKILLCTLDFWPRPVRIKMNVPLQKRSYELTVLIYILCFQSFKGQKFLNS